MILLFGGTTEGKIVADILERAGYPFYYSTKTEIDFKPGQYRFGAFTKESLASFCAEKQIKLIINASHPFAMQLHQTIFDAVKLPVVRFERPYTKRDGYHPHIQYFPSYVRALSYLMAYPQTLLALTGVQSIPILKIYWQSRKAFFRILPRESSIAIAEEAGFPKENLILEMPTNDLEHELAIIEKYKITCILTKDSGESGFLSTKIAAALQAGIPILILERPTLPLTFDTVFDELNLLSTLERALK
jgi:precorrin-6A/cobalt-precorrin-6A reductase